MTVGNLPRAEARSPLAHLSMPECVTFIKMAEEARYVVAEARRYGEKPTSTDMSMMRLASTMVGEVERLRIVLRASRVLAWISLEQALMQGECTESDISLTLSALFQCPALQDTMEELAHDLPPDLGSLSERSRALLARAERLGKRP